MWTIYGLHSENPYLLTVLLSILFNKLHCYGSSAFFAFLSLSYENVQR
jgi:hypothetical protein